MIGLLTAFLIPKTLDHGAKRSKSMVHKVFVYGTLKRNEPNHHWLTNPENGKSKFEAIGTTITRYPLIIATRYNIPFLLKAPGTGWFVKGEVYEVDDYMLGQLDILEDHPNYYVRELDQILIKDEKTNEEYKVECWIYSLPKFRPELLTLPMEEDYRSDGPHGRPYLERDNESTPEDVDEECDEIAKKIFQLKT